MANTGVLTINHYINQIKEFVADVRDTRRTYYVFAARSKPWTAADGSDNDSNVPAANGSVDQYELSTYDDLLFGKIISNNDISYLIPRYNWTANTVYSEYKQSDGELYSKQYFVLNDDYEVYKCIFNNNGAESTVKPSLPYASGTFKSADGYVWKYMYTVDSASNSKFTTSDYIPVSPNTYVQSNAVPGTVDVVKVTDGGSGYSIYESGFLAGVVDPYSVKLPATSSSSNGYYVKSSIYLKAGFGAGQIREIAAYDGVTKTATVSSLNPFEVYFKLDVSNTVGTVLPSYTVEQLSSLITTLYSSGYFNVGANVAQSDSGASGQVISSNSSTIRVVANSALPFVSTFPIVDASQSGNLKGGLVSLTNSGIISVVTTANNGTNYRYIAPATFNANTDVTANSTVALSTASSYSANDLVLYTVSAGNAAVSPLTNNSLYYIEFANATHVSFKSTLAGSKITLTKGATESGHTIGYKVPVTLTNFGISTGGVVYGTTNTTGKVASFTVLNAGSDYFIKPDATVQSSPVTYFNVNTVIGANSGTPNNVIVVNNTLQSNDVFTYFRPSGNTANIGLVSGTVYYVDGATNATHLALKETLVGSTRKTLVEDTVTSEKHIVQGYSASISVYPDRYAVFAYDKAIANATFNANTGVANSFVAVSTAGSYSANDLVLYAVNTGNTPLSGLTNNTLYYVFGANSTHVAFSASPGGPKLTLTPSTTSETGHSVIYRTGIEDYANSDYLRISNTSAAANANIRRVLSVVNTSVLLVTYPFSNVSASNTNHFYMGVAAEPDTITSVSATGTVSNTNLTARRLSVSNSLLSGVVFTLGERVEMVDSSNTTTGANGIVAFANSSTVFVSSAVGTWSSANQFVRGSSSLQKSSIDSVATSESVTISDPSGTFRLGQKVNFKFGSTVTGNAQLVSITTIPNDSTEYLIGPTVKVTGDGTTEARAVGVVNTATGSGNSVIAAEVIDPGKNYTYANVSIYANSIYGSGATAEAIVSPMFGHGYDAVTELGARYAGISVTFDTPSNEVFYLPGFGKYRKVGILESPQYADVKLVLKDFDRANFTLITNTYVTTTSWQSGEVVIQPSTNAAGTVVEGNSSFLQLENVRGNFVVNSTVNTSLISYYSNTTAKMSAASINRFTYGSGNQTVQQLGTGAYATVSLANVSTPANVYLSNVVGRFMTNDVVYDSSTDAYATVNSIYTDMGTKDSSATFGDRFDQTARITLTSATGAFQNNEVVVQKTTNAIARVVSSTDSVDLVISISSGSFAVGQEVTSASNSANGLVIFANNTYLKLTSVSPSIPFGAGVTINNGTGGVATVTTVNKVLVLNDVDGNKFQSGNYDLVGLTSGAVAQCNNATLITYPDLVRETGKVIYLQNISPVTRSRTTKEDIKIVIKF